MTLHSFYTDKGRALAAKIAAGTAEMTISRVVAGSGHTADIPSAIDLPEQKQTLSVGLPDVSGTTATLPVTLLEAQAASDYMLTELGVYALDSGEGEILFQVCQLSEAESITALDEGTLRFYLRQSIGADGVTVTCSPAGVVLEEDIAELRKRAEYADHRNLLDNPWFTVNQRGQSSYTGNVYTVDRWKLVDSIDRLDVTDGGVRVGVTNNTPRITLLAQPIDPALIASLVGKTLTFSVLIRENTFSHTTRFAVTTGGVAVQLYIPAGATGLLSVSRTAIGGSENSVYLVSDEAVTTDNYIEFAAVKLELGEVSTLANDAAPNYAEELAKCQRYFQRFKTQSLRKEDKDDFRPVMRVNPATSTIAVGGTTYYTATADL